MSNYIIPVTISFVLIYGFVNHSDVFNAFLSGVKNGLNTLLSIFPSVLAMLVAANMLRASGLLDMLTGLLTPLTGFLGIPKECAPLMLLKPISGSGATALGTDIIQSYGVDSLTGRIAAVMMATSDTAFFVMSIYFGSLKLKNTRYAASSALIGSLAAFAASAFAVRIFFG